MSSEGPGHFVISGGDPLENECKAHKMTAEVYSKSLADEREHSAYLKSKVAELRVERRELTLLIREVEEHSNMAHVIPEFPGEREHEASVLCWCRPRRDEEDPRLVVHDRMAEA